MFEAAVADPTRPSGMVGVAWGSRCCTATDMSDVRRTRTSYEVFNVASIVAISCH